MKQLFQEPPLLILMKRLYFRSPLLFQRLFSSCAARHREGRAAHALKEQERSGSGSGGGGPSEPSFALFAADYWGVTALGREGTGEKLLPLPPFLETSHARTRAVKTFLSEKV